MSATLTINVVCFRKLQVELLVQEQLSLALFDLEQR